MTVKELIEELKTAPQESIVVMSSDAEGNSYSPLAMSWEAVYVPDSTWSGDVYVGRELTDDLVKEGYSEGDCYDDEDAVDAVILSPTN